MPNPTDRGKPGTKCHLVVDRNGIPLTIYLTAANVHDSTVFKDLLESIEPIKRPGPGHPRVRPCKLHADKAYDCRRLTIRYERNADLHLAFLDLGCALIAFKFLQKGFR